MKSRKDEVLEKAYNLGFEYEKVYKGCSQCSLAAIQDTLDLRDDQVFKASTGLAGGGGLTGIGPCGSYIGAMLAIGQLCGRERENFSDPERKRSKCFALCRKFTLKFIEEFGTIICRDLQIRLLGRPYYLPDPQEFEKFEAAGGHADKCTGVVGRASRLAVTFLLEEGLVSLPRETK